MGQAEREYRFFIVQESTGRESWQERVGYACDTKAMGIVLPAWSYDHERGRDRRNGRQHGEGGICAIAYVGPPCTC